MARWSIGVLFALIAVVIAWQISDDLSPGRVGWALLLSAPLFLPIKGLLRRNRRTYAWATLCVIPYFILGVTEAVADPAQRGWAAACLSLALVLFVSLILYLRVTAEQ